MVKLEQWQASINLFSLEGVNLTNSRLATSVRIWSDNVLQDDLVLALEAVGIAQERRGEAEEAVRVLPAAEDLCGVAV